MTEDDGIIDTDPRGSNPSAKRRRIVAGNLLSDTSAWILELNPLNYEYFLNDGGFLPQKWILLSGKTQKIVKFQRDWIPSCDEGDVFFPFSEMNDLNLSIGIKTVDTFMLDWMYMHVSADTVHVPVTVNGEEIPECGASALFEGDVIKIGGTKSALEYTVRLFVDFHVDNIGQKKELECAICQNLYIDPEMVGCGHSFCSKCIHKIVVRDIDTCPICRTSFLKDESFDLCIFRQKNYALGDAVDLMEKELKEHELVERAIQKEKARVLKCVTELRMPIYAPLVAEYAPQEPH